MRLWHYKLLPFLPKSQLLSQWRELNSIFKKQDNHILINYIYDYSPFDLYIYSLLVIEEMERRGYKIKSYNNMSKYFKHTSVYFHGSRGGIHTLELFKNHHTKRYLIQCFYNLQEKYDRGQKDFSKEEYERLENLVKGVKQWE